MKRLWAALLLLLLTLAAGFYGKYTVDKQIDRTIRLVESLAAAPADARDPLTEPLRSQWDKTKKTLSIWLAHTHIEEVNTRITLLLAAAEDKNEENIREMSLTALEYLKEMREAQIPYLENVF